MSKILSNSNYIQMKETTKQFLKYTKIRAFPIKVKHTETNEIKYGEKKIKKDLMYINHPLYKDTKGYKDFEDKELCEKRMKLLEGKHDFNYLWLDTTNIQQIDIDTNENIPYYINDMLKTMPYYKSGTKSYGRHIFIKCDEEFHKCKYKFECNEDIEFLCGVGAYMPIDAEIINADSEDFKDYFQLSQTLKNYEQPKNNDYVDIEAFKSITPYHKEILDNIDISLWHSYDDWCRFIWAIKFSFQDEKEALQIADFYSRKHDKYETFEYVEKTFMSATEKRISWGYLMNLSKKSNEKAYYIIISKYNDYMNMDDFNLATLTLKLTEGKIIKYDGCIYVYNNPYWLCCEDRKYATALEYKVSHTLREYYSSILSIETQKIKSDNEEIRQRASLKIKVINEIILKKINGRGLDGICKYLKVEIQEEDIEFDTYKPYYFCFKNGVAFDLQTNKQVEIKPHHYITQHTTYDYVKSSSEDIQLIKKLVESIFPEKDARECYMSILRSGMIGILYEKFILANGVGGNGKGLLNDLFASMLGEMYFYKGNILSLTEIKKGGSSPELANMDKKRFIKFCEPNDNDKLKIGQIKEMTGDSKINARMNYSNKTNTILHSTMVLECNKKPKIDGRIDNSVLRRFINIFFPSVFTDDKDLLKCENHFPKNAYYKTEEFKKRYKYALFHYLLSYDYTDIYEPQSIKDITKEYLFENDEFDMVLNEHIEITENKNDYVSLKELKNIYRDLQYREGTRNYKAFTTKKFLEKVNESIIWKKYKSLYYKDRIQVKGKNVKGFTNMRIRENVDDTDNDDE